MHLSYSCYKQKSVDRSNDEPCCLPLPTADYSATAVISLQMSEVLDVSESSAITEFLKNERPLWPQIPTPCPVSECTNNKNYERFNDFMEHWKNIHNSVNTVYRCKLCKQLFGTMKHKKSHSQSRNHQGQKVEFEVIDKINEQYIDPKGTLPYQIGTPTFRKEMRELQRRKESLKRKVQAIEWEANTTELPESETRFHICRDERVVLRNGEIYKDTHMWSPPSRRKRVKLSELK